MRVGYYQGGDAETLLAGLVGLRLCFVDPRVEHAGGAAAPGGLQACRLGSRRRQMSGPTPGNVMAWRHRLSPTGPTVNRAARITSEVVVELAGAFEDRARCHRPSPFIHRSSSQNHLEPPLLSRFYEIEACRQNIRSCSPPSPGCLSRPSRTAQPTSTKRLCGQRSFVQDAPRVRPLACACRYSTLPCSNCRSFCPSLESAGRRTLFAHPGLDRSNHADSPCSWTVVPRVRARAMPCPP
jgi:hypothetical protein